MMYSLVVTGILLANGYEPDPAWQQMMFDKSVNDCAEVKLADASANGGLAMDQSTGHRAEADAILELCRQEMGQQEPEVGKE